MEYFIIGLLAIAVIVLSVYAIKLRRADRQIIEHNKEAEAYNQQLVREIESNTQQLKNTKISIDAQSNVLQSVTKSAEAMRQSAEERAEESYSARVAALEEEYRKRKAELDNKFSNCGEEYARQMAHWEGIVDDLKAKQLAYIQAQQREEELQSNADYYRPVINDVDKNEITMLRNVQLQFFHKDAIDKLIWEVYYKPAYDLLMAHIFASGNKTCGIYRITNTENNQSYIGQSVDIKERFRQHIKSGLACSPATNKLYQQMQQYGVHNFTFEVLEEVPRDKLNERETYWIDFYKTKEFGMNKTGGGA